MTNYLRCEQRKKNFGRDRPHRSVGRVDCTHSAVLKAHIEVDNKSEIVHTVKVTAANEHDVCIRPDPLTGEDERVYGDSCYLGAQKRPEALRKNKVGKPIRYKIKRHPRKTTPPAPKPKSSAGNT